MYNIYIRYRHFYVHNTQPHSIIYLDLQFCTKKKLNSIVHILYFVYIFVFVLKAASFDSVYVKWYVKA